MSDESVGLNVNNDTYVGIIVNNTGIVILQKYKHDREDTQSHEGNHCLGLLLG